MPYAFRPDRLCADCCSASVLYAIYAILTTELDLRVVEENKSKLRGFGSRVMSPKGKDAALYRRLVKQCDEYRKTLCTEKRALMAEFQAQLQQVAEEVD